MPTFALSGPFTATTPDVFPPELGHQCRQLLPVLRRPPPPLLRTDRRRVPHGHDEIQGYHRPRRPPLGRNQHRSQRGRHSHPHRGPRRRFPRQRRRHRHHHSRHPIPVPLPAPREAHRQLRQPLPQRLAEIQRRPQLRRPLRLQLHHPPPLLRQPRRRLDRQRDRAHRHLTQPRLKPETSETTPPASPITSNPSASSRPPSPSASSRISLSPTGSPRRNSATPATTSC